MEESRIVLKIEGMDCEGCGQALSHSLKRIKGVREVKIDWREGVGEVAFDPGMTNPDQILSNPVFMTTYEATVVPASPAERSNTSGTR